MQVMINAMVDCVLLLAIMNKRSRSVEEELCRFVEKSCGLSELKAKQFSVPFSVALSQPSGHSCTAIAHGMFTAASEHQERAL